jgi:7,8-dihydropterin-6-yl-methyl-4-(beta-D-ribofuranosyl)aminobenzene 5'-phosphate synthase
MKLTIIYDNEIYQKDLGLKSDWGFSCLIETENEKILFDTGAKGRILLNNMQKLSINPKEISKVVISHEHWDHNKGLKKLISYVDSLKVYRFKISNLDTKINEIDAENPQNISEGVFSTGKLIGKPVNEQSLVLKGKNGFYVLVGCSHSGVENILSSAKKFGKIIGIIGGMHGFDNFSILKELDFICPCHCTKYKQKLKEIYPKKVCKCGAGKIIEI